MYIFVLFHIVTDVSVALLLVYFMLSSIRFNYMCHNFTHKKSSAKNNTYFPQKHIKTTKGNDCNYHARRARRHKRFHFNFLCFSFSAM